MNKMSYGSILLMCFLMFALGGQDRLSWAPGPTTPDTASVLEAETTAERPVEIAAMEEGLPPPDAKAPTVLDPKTSGITREGAPADPAAPAPLGARAPMAAPPLAPSPASAPGPGFGPACAAGFPLSLPPEAPEHYTTLDWMTEQHRAATIRFQFANGGLLELTQSPSDPREDGAADAPQPPEPLPLPRLLPSDPTPAIDLAWQDDARRYAVRAFGLKEDEVRAWIRSLDPPRPSCDASTNLVD